MTVTSNTALSRLLAVVLLMGLLLLFYLLLMLPLQRHYADNEYQLEQLHRQLADYRRTANSREQIEKLFKSVSPEESAAGYYLKGATQALASAELQAYVRNIIEESGGSLVSTQPIVKTERDPERMVRVSVRMRGRMESLLQVFYRASSGVPVLLTDDVMIRSERSTLSRAEGEQEDDALDVQFTLIGFVKESVL